MSQDDAIIEMIGSDSFGWLLKEFGHETTLRDLPDEILERISSVDITIRNFAKDQNAITAIATITFAYQIAGKIQTARHGPRDMILLKILAKNEKARRDGSRELKHKLWNAPLFELITGEVGDRIRTMATLNSTVCA